MISTETLSELIFLWCVFKVYLSNIDQKQKKYKKNETLNFGRGAALYYDLNIPLDTNSEGLIFSRMPNMQVLCPYYKKKTKHDSNVALTDVWLYL